MADPRDPGWRPAVKLVARGFGYPLLVRRAIRNDSDSLILTDLRALVLSFGTALILLAVVLAYVMSWQPIDFGHFSVYAILGTTVASLTVVALLGGRDLPDDPHLTVTAYRARTFMMVACANMTPLLAMILAFEFPEFGEFRGFTLALLLSVFAFALSLPTSASLDRHQTRLHKSGSPIDIMAELTGIEDLSP